MAKVCVVILFLLSLHCVASSLPPEHEVTRLMLSIEASVDKKDWNKAKTQLGLLEGIDIHPPLTSFYYNGLVYFHFKKYLTAQPFFEHYVINAGVDGEHYIAALKLITGIEELVQNDKHKVASKAVLEALTKPEYVQSLKTLYLTDDPVEALQLQLNSLLTSHSYTGSRLKKSQQKEGVVYRLSVKGHVVQLQIKTFKNGIPTMSTSNLNVLGLDPFVQYECSNLEYACWLLHPANNFHRWVKIDYKRVVIKELSQVFTKLIRLMQQAPSM